VRARTRDRRHACKALKIDALKKIKESMSMTTQASKNAERGETETWHEKKLKDLRSDLRHSGRNAPSRPVFFDDLWQSILHESIDTDSEDRR
jgi:hypothetical protein